MSARDSRHSPSPPRGVCSPVQTAVQIGCCWGAPSAQASVGTKRWIEETNLLLPGSAPGARGSNTSRSQGEMCVGCTTYQGSAWEQPCPWSRIQGHPFPLRCRKNTLHKNFRSLGWNWWPLAQCLQAEVPVPGWWQVGARGQGWLPASTWLCPGGWQHQAALG